MYINDALSGPPLNLGNRGMPKTQLPTESQGIPSHLFHGAHDFVMYQPVMTMTNPGIEAAGQPFSYVSYLFCCC